MTDIRQDDSAMLMALKAGDHPAFTYFYEKYSLQLYRRLLGMVQVEVVAEELLQDLFVKIWERREQIDPEHSFKSYLYRIAERIVYDHFRKLAREAKLEREFTSRLSELHEPIEEGMHAKEIRNWINDAVSRLPAGQKRVFTLCKIEGRTYEEVSELLGISTATINTHITRASKAVRDYILKNQDGAVMLIWAYAVWEMIP